MKSSLNDWDIIGKKQFPLLAPIAIRLSGIAIQSANVERVCKSHNLIHTPIRNRLINKTVQMLLFCYINIRLLNRVNGDMGGFIEQFDNEDQVTEIDSIDVIDVE